MPQPITLENWSHTTDPNVLLLKRPDCVTAIGFAAICWTRVESEMISMVSAVLGRTSRDLAGGYGVSPNRIGFAAMREAETIRVRIKFIDAVLGPMLEGDALDEQWALLRDRLNKRGRERNKVVHAEWGYSEKLPKGLVQKGKDSIASLWLKSDFDEVCQRFLDLERDLHIFMRSVLDAIHNRRITKYVTPDMIIEEDDA